MGTPRRKPFPLSYEERKIIYEMIQQGYTHRSISEKIDRYIDTVSVEIQRNGGTRSYCPHKAQAGFEKRKLAGAQRRSDNFSENEKQSLEESIAAGYTINKTAVISGVSHFRVNRYINKFHPGYKASNDQIRIERLSLESRVTSLEMQLEIIVEQIKELRKCLK